MSEKIFWTVLLSFAAVLCALLILSGIFAENVEAIGRIVSIGGGFTLLALLVFCIIDNWRS